MANYNNGPYITRVASTDLSAKQYYIVTESTSDRTVTLSAAGTTFHIGVIQTPATTGGEVSILSRNAEGTFKVAAGAAFSKGAFLTADSTGRAVGTTSSNDELIGMAMEASGVAGQIVEYLPLSRKY